MSLSCIIIIHDKDINNNSNVIFIMLLLSTVFSKIESSYIANYVVHNCQVVYSLMMRWKIIITIDIWSVSRWKTWVLESTRHIRQGPTTRLRKPPMLHSPATAWEQDTDRCIPTQILEDLINMWAKPYRRCHWFHIQFYSS